MRKTLFVAMASAGLLAACGGGGSSSDAPVVDTPAATTTLSGVASKGLLKQAKVSAYAVDASGTIGSTPLKTVTTDDSGNYTLDLGTYTGAVQLVVEVVPGVTKSKDEATGQDVTLPDDFKLRAVTSVAAPAGGTSQIQNASITPFTELAAKIAVDSGGLTSANIANAGKVVFDLIGVDPVATKPLDASATPPAGATEDQKKYALYNAAVSKLAQSAPTTTDATTLACFTSAGSNDGMKIKCAVEQIAKSVTVTVSGAAVNANLLGLGSALVAASADTSINKTGRTISADDAEGKKLAEVEQDVKAGTVTPITVVTAEQTSDITKAKQFTARLRSNAAAMQSAALDTSLATGLQAFGDSLRTGAVAVTSDTGTTLPLLKAGIELWNSYKAGTTSSTNTPALAGINGGCTVYQGTLPTQFGGSAGAAGQPYVVGSVVATTKDNASWLACSLFQGNRPTAAGQVQYLRTLLLDMSHAGVPSSIPYIAHARKRFLDPGNNNTLTTQNLGSQLAGVVGYTLTGGEVSGAKIVGDLPAGVDASGSLLAARYAVNVDGAASQLASGAIKVTFAGGSFGVVPVGATRASLTLDLSPGGTSVVTAPPLSSDAAQLADAQLSLAASIKTDLGELAGTLVADRFTVDSFGDMVPGHLKFTGSIAAAAGGSGTVTTWLNGTLEASNGAQPVVSFDGKLALPNRPELTLSLSMTRTVAATASTPPAHSVTGRYVQDAVSLQITGADSASGKALTLADSSGVSIALNSGTSTANLLVSGRQTATLDRSRGRIVYSDGTFESLN